jgi:hypothetical protein
MANGVVVLCFAVANPGKDIFLEMLEVELELPSDRHIREVMEAEAQRQGLRLSSSKLAELQPLAGRNPMLARKVIRNEALGFKQTKTEHTQYVVILPIIIAALFAFAVIRFVGMGTGNKGMYITPLLWVLLPLPSEYLRIGSRVDAPPLPPPNRGGLGGWMNPKAFAEVICLMVGIAIACFLHRLIFGRARD